MSRERKAAVRWVLTLLEPLLAESDRAERVATFQAACQRHPAWEALFFAGTISDMVMTLPATDPWRHLSARLGDATVGRTPPAADGARHGIGEPFGSWHDAVDVLEVVYDDITLDPALAALATPLDPVAAALMASAGYGWQAAHRMATEAAATGRLHQAGLDALRWAVHRRRSYGVLSDPWPIESAYRWSWRCDQHVAGRAWDEDAVELSIAEESVEAMLESGQIHPEHD